MKTTITQLLDTCCQDALIFRNLSPKTIQWWRSSTLFYARATQVEYIEDVTPENLRQFFIHGRVDRGWKADTLLGYYKGINAFLAWCTKQGHLGDNPLSTIDRPRVSRIVPKSLTKEEAERVLEAAFHMKYNYRYERYRNHAYLAMLVFTGMRLQESLDLCLNDVDLRSGLVVVRSGKGNKSRAIPLCATLTQSLSAYLKDRERLKKRCVHFFTSLKGDVPFTKAGVRNAISRIRTVACVHFSAHMLRHTFATLMANSGVDLLSIKEMLGHSDIKTTMIYVTALPEHIRAGVDAHPLNQQVRQRGFGRSPIGGAVPTDECTPLWI